MNIVISPAKKLDFKREIDSVDKCPSTLPILDKKIKSLATRMKKCSAQEIKKMMKLSDSLATLNYERYQKFNKKNDKEKAIKAFVGDTYQGLNVETFSKSDVQYAQKHLHILSGLYGVLRSLDEIEPYRLEMGTRLGFEDYKNLYTYWQGDISKTLNDLMKKSKSDILVNLASEEYFKSVKKDELDAQIIDIKFLENKNGIYKTIGIMAKRARGMMASYIVKNKVKDLDALKKFDLDGYKFSKGESSQSELVFKRG